MRRSTLTLQGSLLAAFGLGLLVCGQESTARAAGTIALPTPPNPNVMLLIDTSGSMEDWPNAAVNNCGTTTTASTTDTLCTTTTAGPNKWAAVIAALGGSFPTSPSTTGAYSYFEMVRKSGSPFDSEYMLNAAANPSGHIYDVGYGLNFHRPLAWDSTGSGQWCALGPGSLPGAASGQGVFRFSPAADSPQDSADFYGTSTLQGLTPTGIEMYSTGGNPTGSTAFCTYAQNKDGSIDSARDLVRFGLMTFDSDPSQLTGVSATTATPKYTVTTATPWTGLWSYYPGWNSGTNPSPAWPTSLGPYPDTANTAALTSPYAASPGLYSVGTAQPADSWSLSDGGAQSLVGCACPTTGCPWEVGARNPAAPPWEGRMVQFPDGRAPLSAQEATNDEVKMVLAASRPYGATPIAGMLEDSRNYFRYDPNGPQVTDPFVYSNAGGTNGCRPQYQILLTDGSANLDLRNPTSQTPGTSFASCEPRLDGKSSCPFQRPEDITYDLSTGGASANFAPVTTFVIGFGIEALNGSTSTQVCKDFVTTNGGQANVCTNVSAPASPGAGSSTAPSGACAAPTPGSALDACCNLIKIACNGTTNNNFYTAGPVGPYFADSAADLNGAFAAILSSIARTASSHVVPIFASSSSATSKSAFSSSFTTSATAAWSGDISRSTTTCGSSTPTTEDFGTDLSTLNSFTGRSFFTATATGGDDTITIRPYQPSSTADGVTAVSGTEKGMAKSSAFNGDIQAADLPIPASSCPSDPTTGASLSAAQCYQYVLDFYTGITSATTITAQGTPGKTGLTSYTEVDRKTHPLGPIIDSTPAYAPRPTGTLSDNTYRSYVDSFLDPMTGAPTRPNVLYVASTDGALHAFDADYPTGNAIDPQVELWSFLPPALIPALPQNLPNASKVLLDGAPIVADSVWSRTVTTASSGADWHTTLVSGFGSGGPGYFALDVSKPSLISDSGPATSTNATYNPGPGPHFLWQLTTVDTSHAPLQLFAGHSGTPAITTVFINGAEVGVAILPGGSDGQAPTGTCTRSDQISLASAEIDYTASTIWRPRNKVRMWSTPGSSTSCASAAPVSGRSVSIVRLDNGVVLATFINPVDFTKLKTQTTATTSLNARPINFDSPMTGVPVAFPAGTGKIARAIYISDADGLVWKLDVSASDPTTWQGGLFFDALNKEVLNPVITSAQNLDTVEADISQPLTGPPILSIGRTGNLVLNFATGDQTLFTTKAFAAGSNDTTADERPEWNFVWSVSDINNAPKVNWYAPFAPTGQYNDPPTTNTTCIKGDTTCMVTGTPTYATGNTGERVTGPMSVFDGVLYFASLKPADDTSAACSLAEARIYGMDFEKVDTLDAPANNGTCGSFANEATGVTGVGCGGARRLPALASATSMTMGSGLPQYDRPGDDTTQSLKGTLIPGVSITQSQSCFSTASATDTYFGNGSTSYSTLSTPQQPMLTYLATSNGSKLSGSSVGTAPKTLKVPPPVRTTRVDSWASVIE